MDEKKMNSLQDSILLAVIAFVLSYSNMGNVYFGDAPFRGAISIMSGCVLAFILAVGRITISRYKGRMIIVLMLVTALLYKFLSNGAAIYYNKVSSVVGDTYGENWKQWVVDGNRQLSQFLFAMCVTFWLAIFMIWIGMKRTWWSNTLLCVVGVVVGYTFIIMQLIPVSVWSGFAVAGYILYFLPEQGPKHWLRNHSLQVCVLVLVVLMFGVATNANQDERAFSIKTNLQDQWEQLVYGTDHSIQGDLNRVENLTKDNTPRLEVHMSEPSIMHLRSFVGSRYQGSYDMGVWTPLEDEAYSGEYLEMLDWLSQHKYEPLAAAGTYGGFQAEYENLDPDTIAVSVKHLDVNNKYYYLSENILPESLLGYNKVKRDENVRQNWYDKQLQYDFVAYEWTEQELLTQKAEAYLKEHGKNDENLEPFYNGEINYRRFVYEKYRNDAGETTDTKIDEQSLESVGDEAASLITATKVIRANLEKLPKQTTWEYASKGTLLFRSLGIPARYVEGFYISSDMGEAFTLTDEDMHAWVEVYQDGIGWIAVEVTPGFYDDVNDEDNSSSVQNEDIEEQRQQVEENIDHSITLMNSYILYVILLLLVFMLLVTLVMKIRHYILWNHKDDEVRFRYYAKQLKKLLKKQHRLEQDLPKDIWLVLQARAFGGYTLSKEQIDEIGAFIKNQKRRKRDEV